MQRVRHYGVFVVILSLVLLAAIANRTDALTVNIPASKDNTLYEDLEGNVSNGIGDNFFVGATAGGAIRRGLIAFDIAGHLPAGAVVNSVTLRLTMTRTTSGTQTVALHKVLADWGEGNSNGDDGPGSGQGQGTQAAAGDATWLHTFFPNMRWSKPGGDFVTTASATRTVTAVRAYTWGSTAEMVADVQAWLEQPATNFGWLLQGKENDDRTTKSFDTRESTAQNRPVLTVEFTLLCAGKTVTIPGTSGDDILVGTDDDDVIAGLGGNDVIHGGDGNDIICGGDGDDVLFGDAGRDRLFGDTGNDVLHGGPDNDRLSGGAGHDLLFGEDGDDVLSGGSGDDVLHGGDGSDRLLGGSGHNILRGDAGDDTLNGGTQSDICDGGDGTDTSSTACEITVNIP